MPSLPSLDLLSREARAELDAQERRGDALDTKAGVLLGFSGVIVGLTVSRLDGTIAHIASSFSALGALLASAGYLPRSFPTLRLRTLRDEYLMAEVGFTRLRLLDTRIAMYNQTQRTLARKARLVGASTVALGVGVALTVLAALI